MVEKNEDDLNILVIFILESSIQFTIRVNNRTIEIVLKSETVLSDGKWHYVSIEMDIQNIRCSVDKKSQMLDMPDNQIPSFHGDLYIGGYLK